MRTDTEMRRSCKSYMFPSLKIKKDTRWSFKKHSADKHNETHIHKINKREYTTTCSTSFITNTHGPRALWDAMHVFTRDYCRSGCCLWVGGVRGSEEEVLVYRRHHSSQYICLYVHYWKTGWFYLFQLVFFKRHNHSQSEHIWCLIHMYRGFLTNEISCKMSCIWFHFHWHLPTTVRRALAESSSSVVFTIHVYRPASSSVTSVMVRLSEFTRNLKTNTQK